LRREEPPESPKKRTTRHDATKVVGGSRGTKGEAKGGKQVVGQKLLQLAGRSRLGSPRRGLKKKPSKKKAKLQEKNINPELIIKDGRKRGLKPLITLVEFGEVWEDLYAGPNPQ